jgi:WD40 repeat protein
VQILAIPKKKRIYAIAFAPDGRALAAACGDGFLRVWDLAAGKVRRELPIEETSYGYDLTYLDSDRLIFGGRELGWFDLATGGWNVIAPQLLVNRQHRLSPDGTYLAETDQTTSTDWVHPGGLILRSTSDWARLPFPDDAGATTGGPAFSPDGKLVAAGHILRAGQRQRYFGLIPGGYPVNAYEYVVHIREMPSGRVVRSIGDWGQGVRFLAFSHDGLFLVGTAGPRLRVWDLENDREVALHKRGPKHFQGLSFTADGRYLATVSNDETVRVWETHSWQEHTTFTWKIGKLLNIAFAPDGLRAAAGSDKGQIVIWDVEE